MEVLISEDSINRLIIPHLSSGKREGKFKVLKSAIVKAVLFKLKTGCQWRQLPVESFFKAYQLSWQGVYYHFRKWSADGSWRKVWIALLAQHRQLLDLSSVHLDGSHSIAHNGGEAVGYQKRKAANSSNSLFLADNQGLMLSCSSPVSGQHHDLFQIRQLFEELLALLKEAGIETAGLFLNADAGFDSKVFRSACEEQEIEANIPYNARNKALPEQQYYFDELLYKRRIVIEQANAWLDAFKALLIRYEVKALHWLCLHFIAFSVQLIRKLNKIKLY
ncbi:IS5 family transposase [Adhaeribacter sp. BT258]|uniref:IS5 family transposase n=1 Tax=Adhaeribacter terrigena TaxID=2793070 RepID=A0ABS1C4H1_9BACT|nr:IS5 family transposase [Adhaeribacter terrigena]MBK0404293.1 IS5 family transposase [Adhaeribacter terrigena]